MLSFESLNAYNGYVQPKGLYWMQWYFAYTFCVRILWLDILECMRTPAYMCRSQSMRHRDP